MIRGDIDLGQPTYSSEKVQYHLRLMAQAGLIEYEADRSNSNPDRLIQVYPFDLTWKGQEFLAKIRSESVWERLKTTAIRQTGAISYTALNKIATRLLTTALELPDGGA